MNKFLLCLTAGVGAWMISGWQPLSLLATRYDDARAAELLVLAGLALGAAHQSLARLSPGKPRTAVELGLLTILGLGLLSAASAAAPRYAAIELALMTALVIGAFHVARLAGGVDRDRMRRIALGIVAAGAVVLGLRLSVDFVAALLTGDGRGLSSAWLPFTQVRYFAKATTWALPALWALPLLMPQQRRRLLPLALICSAAIWAQLIGTGSRGALAGLAVTMALTALAFGGTGRAYAGWQTVCALLGLGLWKLSEWHFGLQTSQRIITAGINGRDRLWLDALTDVQNAPWLGIGPMHFAELGRHPDSLGAGAHSLPLQFAAEWGLPAAAIALGLGGYALVRYLLLVRRQCRDTATPTPQAAIDIALFAGLLAAAIHSLVANVLNDPLSQLLAMLAAGLPVPVPVPVPVPSIAGARRGGGVLGPSLALACVAALVLAFRYGWPCIVDSPASRQLPGPYGIVHPRLWSQGLIPFERSCTLIEPR